MKIMLCSAVVKKSRSVTRFVLTPTEHFKYVFGIIIS